MKKRIIGILLAVFILTPAVVYGATTIDIRSEKACLTEDDMCTTTGKIYITTNDLLTDAIEATLTLAEGVEIDSVKGTDQFTVVSSGNKITFTPADGAYDGDGEEILLGTVVFKYSSSLADCSVSFDFKTFNINKDVTITAGTPVQTGSSLSYISIAAGLIVLGISYFAITKHKRIHNV